MNENIRFIQVLDKLKEEGRIADYVQVSAELGTNKAGISDIKSGRKKLSIEILRRLKYSYPDINLEWVIMGKGDAFVAPAKASTNEPSETLVNKIAEQAEEIGCLKERIRQLTIEKEKHVSDAPISSTANVG